MLASAETTTVHQHQVTESFSDIICEGGPTYDITTISNSVFHETVTDTGVHATFTQTGTFTAVRPGEVVTGRFTVWGGYNENPGGAVSGTFTFNARGLSTLGTRVTAHELEHINVRPDGTVHAFFKLSCG